MVAVVLNLLLTASTAFGSSNLSGWQFLEGHSHTVIHFEKWRDLIVIPARLNDTLHVNLILDTGTRSILLCGKKFRGLTNMVDRKMKVTGWGSSEGVDAVLSYPNNLEMGEIKGTSLGVAVITSRRLLDQRPQIDGIIGYELFVRFAVEINYLTQTIHLYDRLSPGQTVGFNALPLEVNKARPQINSTIHLDPRTTIGMKLLIDTGSSLGLTLFATSTDGFRTSKVRSDIGIGLNGTVRGFELYLKGIYLSDLKVEKIPCYLIDAGQHPDEDFTFAGSLGAAFLKEHIVIFDYPRSLFFLKGHENEPREGSRLRSFPWTMPKSPFAADDI